MKKIFKPKICPLCKQQFTPVSARQIVCKAVHYSKCPDCGQPVKISVSYSEYLKNGSLRCHDCAVKQRARSMKELSEDRKQQILEKKKTASLKRYGTEYPTQSQVVKDKTQQTNIERYGTSNPMQFDKIQQKVIESNLERYGVEYYTQTDEFQDKSKQTCLERYGTEYASQSEDVKSAIKQSIQNTYGVDSYFQSDEFKTKSQQTCFERYGVDNVSRLDSVKQRSRETSLHRYGTEYPTQSAEIQSKIKATNLKRYGTSSVFQNEEVKKKSRQTLYEHYHVDHPMKSAEIVDKTIETNLRRYGVQRPAQLEEFREQIRQTCLDRYGVEYPIQLDEFKTKQKETVLEKYGTVGVTSNPEVRDKVIRTNLERYGVPWTCMRPEAHNHKAISKLNKSFSEILTENNIQHEPEFRLGHYIYDFKIDNILVEINPTITHNSYFDIFDKTSSGKDVNYHLNKLKVAQANGYRLIHIFDWDDINKHISLLKSKTPIYARKCKIQEVSSKECKRFLDNYHIQNSCKGQNIRLGLYYDDKLVEIMTFGKPRYNKNYEYELLRLCSSPEYAVVGGAEKLFKHFIRLYSPKSIISYCDRSKFSGDVYFRIGMKLLSTTNPAKIWSKGKDKITDNLLRQRGYDQLFNANYGKGTDNETLMIQNNWLPVYDCGQSVFSWNCE